MSSSSAATDHSHHHHLRPNRITLPPRAAAAPYPISTPTPTPSKHRLLPRSSSSTSSSSSISFPLIILFSLRSLYSLLPFLRSSPNSFTLFPFAFLVSLFSFLLTFLFYFKSQTQPSSSVVLALAKSQNKTLFAKSILLALTFLLRFQALRYCGTSAMILAELAGNLFGRVLVLSNGGGGGGKMGNLRFIRVGFFALFSGLVLLCISWDRVECFPFSNVNIRRRERGYLDMVFPSGDCMRVWPMLLPFFAGFLGCCEKVLTVKDLGLKKVRLVTLFYSTVLLFVPAALSMVVFEAEGDSVSVSGFGWPLVNTVVFGVLLSENYAEERVGYGSKDFEREYLVTFVCVVVLELFYYPELSLWGLLVCGILMWIAVRELSPVSYDYPKLGYEDTESFGASVMKPIRHILSERKSRKIAMFLLINTAYMVVEFVAGFMSNSLGLISDACHMLFDCAALAIGLYASYISYLPANSQWNYGRGRFEVLSGYVNAVFLVLVGALITLESFERILDPQEISTSSLLSVSIGGLFVNVIGLIFFHEEHHAAHGGGSGTCSHSHSDTNHHHHVHDHHDKENSCSSHDHKTCHNNHEDVVKAEQEVEQSRCNDRDHHIHHHHVNLHDNHNSHVNPHNHDHRHHVHVDECDHDHGKNKHHHQHQNHHPVESHESHDHHNHGNHHHHIHVDEHDLNHGKNKHHHHHHHHHIDHNMQGIFLHVLADTMGSVGVVISTLLIKYKGWLVADPACSIFISALIVSSVIPLLKNSAEILLQRVPRSHEHDIKEAISSLMKLKGVFGIQNLHVWSFTNTDIVGTVHLLVSAETDKDTVKEEASCMLHDAGIKDLTMQIECVHLDRANQ